VSIRPIARARSAESSSPPHRTLAIIGTRRAAISWTLAGTYLFRSLSRPEAWGAGIAIHELSIAFSTMNS
jgi:hypothetical protein